MSASPGRPASSRSVRGAALWSMGSQYVSYGMAFAVSVLISRFFLGPEEVGLFSIALAAALLVSVLQDFGITRYIAGEAELTVERVRACFTVSLLVALGVGLGILALAWPIAGFYGDARLAPIVAVIAASYLFVPFAIVPSALLQRDMDFRALFAVQTGAALLSGGIALVLAAAGYSAMSLAWSVVAQQVGKAILGMALSGWRPPATLDLGGARPILGFGGGMSALAISGAIGTRTPDLIVGRLIGIAATGLYSRASGLAGQLVTVLTGAVGAVFYPAFARMRDRGEPLGPPYLRVVSGYTAITWPALLFLAAAALPVTVMLYGEDWRGVAPLLALIALSEFAFTALPLQLELPILLGRMRLLLALNILDTVVAVTVLVVGALWSLEAAAASRIVYGFVWWFIYAGLLRGLVGLRWRDLIDVYARSFAVTLAAAAPLLSIYALVEGPATLSPWLLLLAVVAGALGWLGALFAVRHPARLEIRGFAEVLLEPMRRRRPISRPATARD